jgi:predicted nucleic acid-binding protein
MIVVDTNVIAGFYLAGEASEAAERLFLQDSQWAAPLLWRSEFRNVLRLQIRKRGLRLADAQKLMLEAVELMAGREYEVSSKVVLALVARSGCSAYDCEFVAVAQELGVPLVTADQEVLREFPTVAVALTKYA